MNFRAVFSLIVFLFVFCALTGNICGQDEAPQISRKYFDQAEKELALINIIKNGTTEEKRNLLFQIRNEQSPYSSNFAIPALKDSSEIVRATAAFAVIYLPKDEAFNVLSPNLSDKAEIVRRETAYALGKVQNPSAINLLLQTFQNKKEKSIEVKNACIVALGEIGDASAIDALTQILQEKPKDDNDFLRRSAARSIGQIAQIIQIKESYTVTPESFLPEKFKLLTIKKYRNLAAKFSQFRAAAAVLALALQNPKESADARREAAFALGAIGDVSAVSVLQNNLNSGDYYLAEICKESLKKLSNASAAE